MAARIGRGDTVRTVQAPHPHASSMMRPPTGPDSRVH